MSIRRLTVASLLAAGALTFAAPAQAQRVDNVVAFGDSYADFGIARTTIINDPAANPAFQAVVTQIYPTGRFSGSTNYVDTLSDILNAPVANFAVGGALARTFPGGSNNTNCTPAFGGQPSPATCPLGLAYEVDQFLNVGVQSPLFPSGGAVFDEGDLVTLSVGGNDARFYQVTGGSLANATTEAALSVTAATTQIDRLVAAGAPTISFLAGDTSRLPEVIGNTAAQQVRAAYSNAFNTGIQGTLAGYAADGVMIHYLDLNLMLDNVLANPAAYGITQGSAASLFTCPSPTPAAPGCLINSTGYLFYFDGLHLSSTGFAIVAQYIATQLTAPLTLQAPSDLGLDVARQFGRTLTTRMDTGSPRDGDTTEGIKFFLSGDGVTRHQDAGERNLDYRATSVGATAGIQYGFGAGVAGIAVNYSKPKANFTSDASEVEGRSIQVGGYAGIGIAGAFAQAYAGYGWDKHDIDRAGVVEGMEADPKGHHFLIGAKGGYLMPLGAVRVGPVVALDYAKAKVDGYTETGDPALTLHVDSVSYKSLRGSAGIEVRGDFEGGGVQLRPYASALVEKDFSGDERTVRFAQTSAPTIVNGFAFEDGSKKAYGRFSAGFGAAILTGVSLDIAGSATIGKDQGEETSAHLGLRIGF
jgi:phospholipase/lecithinase/hemolysin/uncharacterized protein YhjY with autotransporter beta-barrel domain